MVTSEVGSVGNKAAHLRPRYHFLPPSGWLNDPNGLIHRNGVYHLFYQHNPSGPHWGNIHWGHATSVDLVNWTHQPLALSPYAGSPDAGGCWSGCALDVGGQPVLVYTGNQGNQTLPCLAYGDADLRVWRKDDANPIVAWPDVEPPLTGFRDPSVWRDGEFWRMLVGAGRAGSGGMLRHYVSNDFRTWNSLGTYSVEAPQDSPLGGTIWECPQLLTFGSWSLLLLSIWDETPRNVVWVAGHDTGHGLLGKRAGQLDHGDLFYAPQAMRDPDGRWIAFGWIQERPREERPAEDGWSGVLSLPRILEVTSDGTLVQTPAPEIRSLRRNHRYWEQVVVNPDERPDWGILGSAVELQCRWEVRDGAVFGFSVFGAADRSEETTILINVDLQELQVTRSDVFSGTIPPLRLPLLLIPGVPVGFTVFLDGSVLEVFTASGQCLTTRVYPRSVESAHIVPISRSKASRLDELHSWELG